MEVRVEVNSGEFDEPAYEYWGGATSQQSIDVYAFWRSFSAQIPLLNNVICQILSHRSASTTAETTFSLGGYCLNELRTSLLPARAEGYILSALAFKMQQGMKDLVVSNKRLSTSVKNMVMCLLQSTTATYSICASWTRMKKPTMTMRMRMPNSSLSSDSYQV